MHECELSGVIGLPGPLPPGERVLWQGRPDWKALAIRALHVRGLLAYFVIIIALTEATSLRSGTPLPDVAFSFLRLGGVALIPVLLLVAYAVCAARTTVYTITNRRVGVQLGLALSMTLNIPLRTVGSAALKLRADSGGDIALSLSTNHKLNYLVLWPFARPWHIVHPQPMLRALPEAKHVADILAAALQSSLPVAVRVPVGARAAADVQRVTLAA